MILNAVMTFYEEATGKITVELFCDPNIYIGPDQQLWNWNGKEWHRGQMTWGGQPVGDQLLFEPNARHGGPPPSSTYPAAVAT